VVVLAVHTAQAPDVDLEPLKEFLAKRGVACETQVVKGAGEAAPLLLKTAQEMGASLFVAGAYGHPRLQEFIFGGATRTFLNADAPSLFLSH